MKYLNIKYYWQCEYSGLQHKLKVYPIYKLDGIEYRNVAVCQRCYAAFIFISSVGNLDITKIDKIVEGIRQYEFKKLSKLLQHQSAMRQNIKISKLVMSDKRVQETREFAEEVAKISSLERKKHTKQNIWRMPK